MPAWSLVLVAIVVVAAAVAVTRIARDRQS
jgi:hypothetical protein